MDTESTVYLVDDEAIRDATSRALKIKGYKVVSYSCTEEFLDDLHPQQPGCLLLDISMPGMSGMEL